MATERFVILSLVAAIFAAGCAAPGAVKDDVSAIPKPANVVLAPLFDAQRVTIPHSMDMREFHAHSDPTNPDRIAVGIVGRTCDAYLSEDRGRTWTEITPKHWNESLLDPWIIFDHKGGLHMMCMDNGKHLTHSDDAGKTWTPPARIPGSGWDRPVFLAASDGAWYHCATGGGSPRVLYSRDEGATWIRAQYPPHRGGCDEMLEGPDGTIYATYHRFDTIPALTLGTIYSRDQGATWEYGAGLIRMETEVGRNPACQALPFESPGHIACIVAFALVPDGAPSSWMLPSWSVHPQTGDVYVAYTDFRDTGPNQALTEVRLMRSHDHGNTWDPVPLPLEAQRCPDCNVYRPSIAFSGTGDLGLRWKKGTEHGVNEHWFAASPDGDGTWTASILLGHTTHKPLYYDGGLHYWHLASTDDGFAVLWLTNDAGGPFFLKSQAFAMRRELP